MIPSSDNIKSTLMIAGVAVAGYMAYKAYKKVGEAVDAGTHVITHELNPTSPDNLASSSVDWLVQSITGDEHQTLGGWVFDVTH